MPGLIVLAAFVLSVVTVAADRMFGPALLEHVPFLFGGTADYALLVLREIRSPSEGSVAFIPALAVTTGIVLTLCCMGLLVYCFHDAAQSLQVATILQDVHDEVLELIECLFLEDVAAPVHEREDVPATLPAAPPVEVRATGAGFLRSIDIERLEHVADADVYLVRVVIARI